MARRGRGCERWEVEQVSNSSIQGTDRMELATHQSCVAWARSGIGRWEAGQQVCNPVALKFVEFRCSRRRFEGAADSEQQQADTGRLCRVVSEGEQRVFVIAAILLILSHLAQLASTLGPSLKRV